MRYLKRLLDRLIAFIMLPYLAGNKFVLLNPIGNVAKIESNLIILCTCIMFLIVIPVMVAVVFLAFRYRSSNKDSEYLPDWGHSTTVEIYMWGIPALMVVVLGAITYYYAVKLDPYKRVPVATSSSPLEIQVVSLNWKWLFIYPKEGVASVNELYIPEKREVRFDVTSEDNINSFWIPHLGSMIYAMPGMHAVVHLISEKTGVFDGLSANYSGQGFSNMHFKTYSVNEQNFKDWISKLRQTSNSLDPKSYLELSKPTVEYAKGYYSTVSPGLFYRISNRCTQEGQTCISANVADAANKTLWGSLCSGLGFDGKSKSVWRSQINSFYKKDIVLSKTH